MNAPVTQSPQTPRQDPLVDRELRPDRLHYADLIDPDEMSREQKCLAEAVYFEARSEPVAGCSPKSPEARTRV